MEPGNQNKQLSLACLLPTGSASEEIEGISHLFEHIFATILHNRCPCAYQKLRVHGHTTEDYVILFCSHFTTENILQTLSGMKFAEIDLDYQKQQLKNEIERETSNREEFFFRFVWEGTDYEKSPLGSIARVDTITAAILEDFRRQLINKNILFYSRDKGIEILNLSNSETSPVPGKPLSLPIAQSWRKSRPFREKLYDIYYFNRDIEAFYLLERVLKELNPARHIQVSEKKYMSAMIIEKGAAFPSGQDIRFLEEKAFEGINRDLGDIKANFREQAVNELESVYFYGQQWQDRVVRLFNTTERRLVELVKQIKI
ncbi:MAG: Insulinase family protein [Acidobacteriota bacterium]|nr:Insulinase family protein [Acidobacteriota bacterium]